MKLNELRFGSVMVGLFVGLLVAVGVHRIGGNEQRRSERPERLPAPVVAAASATSADLQNHERLRVSYQLATMERRIVGLEARDAGSPQETPVRDQPTPPMSHEEGVARSRDVREAYLARHAAQRVDSSWAAEVSRELTSSLTEMARASGFQFGQVDCRTSSCRVDLEWPDCARAVNERMTIMGHRYTRACTRTFFMETPTPNATRCNAVFVLDCTGSSARNNVSPAAGI